MTIPLDKARILEILRNLGLTPYEARVYIGLLGVGGRTATEIHEFSGVPRASVYPALDRLIQKNLVSVSHTAPRRFLAVSPEEGIRHLVGRLEDDAGIAIDVLGKIHREHQARGRVEQELIWSIHGKENILDRLNNLIGTTQSGISLIAHWDLLRQGIADKILRLPPSRTVDVVCDRWEGVANHISLRIAPIPPIRDRTPSPEMAGIFLIDGSKAMVIMGKNDETLSALFSESAGFVLFFSRYYQFVRDWADRSSSH